MEEQRWTRAEAQFSKAVRIYPQFAPAWDALGGLLEIEGHPDLAEDDSLKAIQVDPGYPKSYVDLAGRDLLNQRWGEAVELATKAAHLNPVDYPVGWLYGAIAALHLKKWKLAEVEALGAIARNSGFYSLGELVLAEAFDGQGETPEAMLHYQLYLRSVPEAIRARQVEQRVQELSEGESKSQIYEPAMSR